MLLSVTVFVSFILTTHSATLPKFLRICKGTEPNFNKCALESGREALKNLLPGVKSLNIVPLSPLKLPFVTIGDRGDFTLNVTNANVSGLEKAKLTDFRADLNKRQVKLEAFIDRLSLSGLFRFLGKILILTLDEEGPGEILGLNGNYSYSFDYNLIKKGNRKFAVITNDYFDLSIGKLEVNFENLFRDKALGRHTTMFFNDNWQDVFKEFKDVFSVAMGKICRNVASGIFENVPFSDIILE